MAIQTINVGAAPNDGTGDKNRVAFIKANGNFADLQVQISNLSGLNMVAGPVTKLPAGSNPTATLTGSAPNYTLNLGLPEGPAGAGAPTSADILAIPEMSRLERALASAGVPDESSLIVDFIRGVHFASKSVITASILTMVAALGGFSTFARASTATYFDSDGLLKTAANNVPRIEYDPVTRAIRGLLIENQARTNLYTYSEQLNDASYTKVRSTVTADAAVAPTGLTTADKIVEDTTATNTHLLVKSGTVASGSVYTVSGFFKAAERSQVQLQFDDGSAVTYASAKFNLTSGAVSSISGTGATAFATNCGNGWWRLEVTGTTTSTTGRAVVYLLDATGNATYTGDGTSGLYGWGTQLEPGSRASSYIPTTASTVTRASDSLTLAGAQWLTGTALSSLIECRLNEIRGAGTTSNLVFFQDASLANIAWVREGSVIVGADFCTKASGTNQIDSGSYATAVATVMRFAFGLDAASYGFAKDNVISMTGGSSSYPSGMDRLVLGPSGFMGHIRRVVVWPQRLSNTKVQALSNQAAWS